MPSGKIAGGLISYPAESRQFHVRSVAVQASVDKRRGSYGVAWLLRRGIVLPGDAVGSLFVCAGFKGCLCVAEKANMKSENIIGEDTSIHSALQ